MPWEILWSGNQGNSEFCGSAQQNGSMAFTSPQYKGDEELSPKERQQREEPSRVPVASSGDRKELLEQWAWPGLDKLVHFVSLSLGTHATWVA